MVSEPKALSDVVSLFKDKKNRPHLGATGKYGAAVWSRAERGLSVWRWVQWAGSTSANGEMGTRDKASAQAGGDKEATRVGEAGG